MTPVQAGKTYRLLIHGFAHGGEGVGSFEGFTVFVPGVLPGETAQVQVDEVRKSFARASLLTIVDASAERVLPPCPVYEQCGGCQLQHLDYTGQLKMKRQQVREAFLRIGNLPNTEVLPVLGAEDPWHYRNKAQFPVGLQSGNLIAGCFAKGTHRVISTSDCLIQRRENNEVMRQVCRIASQLDIQPYDEKTGKGILRHIMARYARATDELMAVLVTAVEDFSGKEKLVSQLVERLPGLRSVIQNVNPARTNVVLGPKNIVLWGASEIREELAGYRFRISAPSFFQVNHQQTLKLYSEAVKLASAGLKDEVLDLYCGAGTISLFLARQAKFVYGIELSKEAVEDAWHNAKLNTIENVRFSAGDVRTLLQKFSSTTTRPSIAVLDPPRAGCEPDVLKGLINLNLKRIVYVSCNPSTLARDVAHLASVGYRVGHVQPVDMFPHTAHVECVALIEKK